MDNRLHFSQWDVNSVYILQEASSVVYSSEGQNADMMAGFGAAVVDLEVETDANVRVTI